MSDNDQPGHSLLGMQGPPGSGKSTLGQALSRGLGWPLIDKDDVRDLLDDANPGLDYDLMFNVVRRQLRQGLSMVANSPLGYRRTYERAAQIAGETGAALVIIACHCPDEGLCCQRIAARRSLPSRRTPRWQPTSRRWPPMLWRSPKLRLRAEAAGVKLARQREEEEELRALMRRRHAALSASGVSYATEASEEAPAGVWTRLGRWWRG